MRYPVALLAVLLAACGSAASGAPCSSPLPATVAGRGQPCGTGGRLVEKIATNLKNYSPGASIVITVTATNTSNEQCAVPTACPPLAVAIVDSGGRQAWSTPTAGRVCTALARLMQPGETVDYPVRVDGVVLATGLYSVTGAKPDSAAAYGRSYFTVC